MAHPKVIPVKTLRDFTDQVEQALQLSKASSPGAKHVVNWYRGHGLAKSFKLSPTLYRHPKIKKFNELLLLEKSMLEDFNRQSVLHEFAASVKEDWRFEMLFYMQHYGVPTRLLDWSANPFIALYFALTDSPAGSGQKAKEDAAVWILDPTAWNRKALDELAWNDRGVAQPGDKEIKSYYPQAQYEATDIQNIYKHPVALVGVANNARMFAQKGVFTIFGKATEPMEAVYHVSGFPADCLSMLSIAKTDILPMLETLIAFGYTDSVSYPDLHGLARELRRMNGFLRP
jgi:hypothetical protein